MNCFLPSYLFLTLSWTRSRRYRSATENISSLSADGFDRNAITPGTDFMQWLSESVRPTHPTPIAPDNKQRILQLRGWILCKLRPVAQGGDAAWQNLRHDPLATLVLALVALTFFFSVCF